MQHYSEDEPYEREPLEPLHRYDHHPPSRPPVPRHQSFPEASSSRYYDPPTERRAEGYHNGSGYPQHQASPGHENPRYRESPHHNGRGVGAAPMGIGGDEMADSGMEAIYGTSKVPPPPSRAHNPQAHHRPHSQHPAGGYQYESGYGYGQNPAGPSSSSSLSTGGPASIHHASRSHSRSPYTGAYGDPYADDPYSSYPAASRASDPQLGVVNPNEIEDDGDDGLYYSKNSQRNSFLGGSHSGRSGKPGFGIAVAGTGAPAAGAEGVFVHSGNQGDAAGYDLGESPEKVPGWGNKPEVKRKRRKWLIITLVFFVITGAVVGGVVGGVVMNRNSTGGGRAAQSAQKDQERNGDLVQDSEEIQQLLKNPNLHRVFPGMDYTPLNTQYPDCLHNEPSQNNITRDVAVLSQLTDKIRLYGTDCNQTQMVIEAINRLDLKDDMKIWMGVWLDGNFTTNNRQLDQMWTILEEYGSEPFEGVIVANEILFRQEMNIAQLSSNLTEVRERLGQMNNIRDDFPVATSDLGDDWRPDLARASDYIMANIHPFFAGVDASEAANWTMTFWETNNGPLFKSDAKRNIISETGWPTGGGTHCGSAPTCTGGSVAGIDELNQFMSDWVCQALEDGTEYFWFSAFDEPWKIRFNEEGKEWEDKWGLMDVNRRLKNGVQIPNCGGRTVGNSASRR